MAVIKSIDEVLVNVVMVTYNQEKYISQAIESVLMQCCNFKYKLIISDDGSVDKTKEICKYYSNLHSDKIIYLDNNQNVGLVRNYKRAFDLCIAEFIAILEGDDYWLDKYKLEKQVNILENSQEIGLVHSNFYILQNGELKPNVQKSSDTREGDLFNQLLLKNLICPLTVVFRRELYEKHIDYNFFIENNFSTIDYGLWLGIAANSKIKYNNEFLGVYRREIGSISNSNDFVKTNNFVETAFIVQEYYAKKYCVSEKLLKKAHNNLYYVLLSSAIYFNDYKYVQFYLRLFIPTTIKGLLLWIKGLCLITYRWIVNS